MKTVEVIARNGLIAKFTVTAGATRKATEEAIAEKLSSGEGVIWTDDADGIRVVCISGDDVYKPRRRFHLKDGGKFEAAPNDEKEE